MASKEATARIKINKLLEAAGWRFFSEGALQANIQLEPKVTIQKAALDALGEDFEKSANGFVDFLLLNDKGFPFIVLEAKAEGKSPLVGKEQARKYAKSQNCRFIMLSNGNLHYFWDLERGNGNIFFSTQAALEAKITEILRVVNEIQMHSSPIIQRCYSRFLAEGNDPDDREYADDVDQIREVLIHEHYLSRKDIEICAAFDISEYKTHNNIRNIEALHHSLRSHYAGS